MPIRVGLEVGEFKYKERFKTKDDLGVVLVGDITQGTVSRGMMIQIGSRSIPVLGMEQYNDTKDFGLLVLGSNIDEYGVAPELVPGTGFFIVQSVPVVESQGKTLLEDVAAILLAPLSIA